MKISKLLLALCALTLAQESLAMDSDGNRPGWDKDSNGGTYPTWPFSPDYTPRDEPSQPTSSSPSTTISSGPTIDPSNPINQAWIQARNGVTVTKGYVPSNAKPTVVSGVSILSGRTPETVKACERETAEYLKDRENLAKKNTELREKIKGAIFELDRRAAVSLQLSTGRWDVKDATRIAGVLCGLDELNTLAGQYTNPELAAEMANSPSGNQEAYGLSGDSLRASLEYLAEMSRSVETPEAFAEKQGLFAFAKATGEVLLDLATSLTPGVSAGRDAYEAFTGKNLLTQVDLTPFERSVAVLCVTSFGTGSILKGALKGVERIAGLARAGHRVEVAEHALKDAVTGAERAIVAAEKHGIELVVGPNASKVDKVIAETLVGNGNITSRVTLSADEALQAGNKWVGPGYRERPTAPGVFTSADGKWQFRMDEGSIAGRHNPNVPHVHFEELIPETGKFKVNNHVPFQD